MSDIIRFDRSATVLLVVLVTCVACSPPLRPESETSTDPAPTTAETTSTQSTGTAPGSSSFPADVDVGPCSREINGDVLINADNVEMFRDVRMISGHIDVSSETLPYDDLSFLECLQVAGSMRIALGTPLSSTAGMPGLHTLSILIVEGASESGLMVEGLDGVTSLDALNVGVIARFKGFDMPYIERIGYLRVGSCYSDAPEPVASQFTSFSGFSALRELDTLGLYANSSLQDLAIIDVLLENDAPPLTSAGLMFNHSLPTELILEKLGAIGVVNEPTICGNLGDDTPCSCPPVG